MPRLRHLLLCLLLSAPSLSAHADAPSAALAIQIERLVELLGDSYSSGYPEASLYRLAAPQQTDSPAFAVFTVEGYGGGNGHLQYLAAFQRGQGRDGKEHYQFLDVVRIGGKGFRSIHDIDALELLPAGGMRVHLSGMANSAEDAPNFPSQPLQLQRDLIQGRFLGES